MIRRFTIALALSAVLARIFLSSGAVVARQIEPPSRLDGSGATTTRLADGRLLQLGGWGPNGPVSSAILTDPRTQTTIALSNGLNEARAWHTATILPDGSVLILGGHGRNGSLLTSAERFDPATETFSLLDIAGATPRAAHAATLLTDGRILVVGGTTDGRQTAPAELWDIDAHAVRRVPDADAGPSSMTTLMADGRVWIERTSGADGATAQVFDPRTNAASNTSGPMPTDGGILTVAETRPGNSARDVALDVRITIRFSHPVSSDAIADGSVLLTSPDGPVSTQLVPADGGRLLFIRPFDALSPQTTYQLTLSGLTDAAGLPLSATPLMFTTQARTTTDVPDPEPWIPDPDGFTDWRTHRAPSPWQTLPPLRARPGETALAGQVLTLDGRPLPRVTLRLDADQIETDRTGRFLLTLHAAPQGRRQLFIDGHTANVGNRTYGLFEYGLTLKPGVTTVLPFTIWLPRLDLAHQVTIPSPTVTEIVIKTPYIVGLELHLPANTIIRGEDGRAVTHVGITPIPVDRPPFPLAKNVDVPVYFTIQPGSAYIQTAGSGPKGGWLVYPNYHRAIPGQQVEFFHYDPDVKDWFVYGIGHVTASAAQVQPDATTRLYQFTGAMINDGESNPPAGGTPGGPTRGEPVDPSTGVFLLHKTDLYLPDVIPLALTRTYNSGDNVARVFGRGMTHPYAMFLSSQAQYSQADLVLPEGGLIHYVRVSAGTGSTDAVFEHTATPTAFYKSRLAWNGNGWDLTLTDGTVYVFGENAPLQAIRDRYGNTVTVTRTGGQMGNITRVTSANGRWLAFTYDASNRIMQVADNAGRTVGYTYDAAGNLATVTDPENNVTTYTYDPTSNQLATIKDGRNIVYLTNQYDPATGLVRQQTLADPTYTYTFAYTGQAGSITQTDITNPRGYVERLAFNSSHYITSDTEALGTPVQRTTTTERQPASNLVSAVTDGLNRRTEYAYDTTGHVLTVKRLAGTPDAVTTTFTYEGNFFQVSSVTDPLNHTWTIGHDSAGKLTSLTDPLSHRWLVTMNSAGQLTSVTDPLTHLWQFGYTSGDQTSVTDPLNALRQQFFDGAGRVALTTDPVGRVTQTVFDRLNRVTAVIDPLGGRTAFGYDPNGNVLTVTDALTHQTQYSYDASNRIATRTDPLLNVETFPLYDGRNNLLRRKDRKTQLTQYQYDPLDRLSQITFADNSTITYTYDAGDRLTPIADSANGTIARQYDLLDRVTQETTPQGTVNYTYDAAGRRKTMTVAGQPAITYGYDDANRLKSITQGAATVSFTYDNANRRSALTFPNGIVATYGYDNADHVISLAYTQGATTLGTLSYTYDLAGSRTSVGGTWARTALPTALGSATYDAANHITTSGGTAFSYDSNGNLISDGLTSYSWNARNQLTGLSGGISAAFAYDASGQRRSKTVNGTTTQFLYDGFNVVQELAANGTPLANLPMASAIDESLVRIDSSGLNTLLVDGVGSTLALADGTGAVQTAYTYDPFGATTASGTSSPNSFQFTGRENDGTGVYFYRARYYSSGADRFIAEDPIGFAGGQVNLYAYAFNSPTNFLDPTGETAEVITIPWPLLPEIGVGAGIGIGVGIGAGVGGIICATSPACREYVKCLWELAKDLSKCVGKGLCPGTTQEETQACFDRAADNFRRCRQGLIPVYPDPRSPDIRVPRNPDGTIPFPRR